MAATVVEVYQAECAGLGVHANSGIVRLLLKHEEEQQQLQQNGAGAVSAATTMAFARQRLTRTMGMRELNLMHNLVGAKGVRALHPVFTHYHATLRTLVLRRNRLDNTAVVSLAKLLAKGFPALHTVDLCENPFTYQAAKHLPWMCEGVVSPGMPDSHHHHRHGASSHPQPAGGEGGVEDLSMRNCWVGQDNNIREVLIHGCLMSDVLLRAVQGRIAASILRREMRKGRVQEYEEALERREAEARERALSVAHAQSSSYYASPVDQGLVHGGFPHCTNDTSVQSDVLQIVSPTRNVEEADVADAHHPGSPFDKDRATNEEGEVEEAGARKESDHTVPPSHTSEAVAARSPVPTHGGAEDPTLWQSSTVTDWGEAKEAVAANAGLPVTRALPEASWLDDELPVEPITATVETAGKESGDVSSDRVLATHRYANERNYEYGGRTAPLGSADDDVVVVSEGDHAADAREPPEGAVSSSSSRSSSAGARERDDQGAFDEELFAAQLRESAQHVQSDEPAWL